VEHVVEITDDGFYPLTVEGRLASVHAAMSRAPERHGDLIPKSGATLLCPMDDVVSIRDFADFEGHMLNVRVGSGQELPESWYKQPAFYFSNPSAVVGPDEPVMIPHGCRVMDFELSVACVIGREVADLRAEEIDLEAVVAGFVLFNDWSARDLQMVQRDLQLGPGKGKDFANGIGPWLVTPDEMDDLASGRPRCRLEARINGEMLAVGELADMHFSWHEIIAHASANTCLRPGEVLSCGTVTLGCLIENRNLHGRENFPWLRPGDVVELDGGHLGILRNEVVGR
jgi:fumarylacetoacetate (FAA) hydrolase